MDDKVVDGPAAPRLASPRLSRVWVPGERAVLRVSSAAEWAKFSTRLNKSSPCDSGAVLHIVPSHGFLHLTVRKCWGREGGVGGGVLIFSI